MTKFKIEEIEIVNAKVKFYKLIINGRCLFDEFCNEIKTDGNYEEELDTIQAIIERKAQMQPVPPKKFKELERDKKDQYKDYELRSPKLRVYLFKHESTGQIIVLGGIKNPKGQKQDIAKMRTIKKEYFNLIKNSK